jgi:hypothetical protein
MSFPLSAAEMEDYCIIPPYVKRDVKPNILILMDNAAVMGEAAYYPVTDNYDPAKTYSGLFNENLMYTYGARRVYTDSGGNDWIPDNGTDSDPNGDGQPGVFSGNLLNWATTSKYDLLESILVGGKSASRQAANVNTLLSVSNTWIKTFSYTDSMSNTRICKFFVSGANVKIEDHTPESCGYLDTPPMPQLLDMRTTMNTTDDGQKAFAKSNNILRGFVRQSLGFLNDIMNFLTPDAEAAQLRITTSALPDGTECTAYSATISAGGGTVSGYTWSITAGSLPAGLSLDASGTVSTSITGTTTAVADTYVFTVHVRDSGGNTDTKQLRLKINDATVSITTTSMPDGTDGSWYRSPIVSSGACTNTTTWSRTAGSLPPGLNLNKDMTCANPSNCVFVSGTPNTAGTYNFTVQVTDSKSNSTTKAFSIIINPSAGTFQIVTASPLAVAVEGTYYLADIATSGSTCGACCSCPSTYSWDPPVSLPAGLSFNNPPGILCRDGDRVYITGTPTNTGTSNFTITVTDCHGNVATKDFSLTVNRTPPAVRTTGNLNVKLCTGTYTVNCNSSVSCNSSNVPACPAPCNPYYTDRCVLKSGIVDQIWTQARLGVQDFTTSAGDPNMSNCIEDDPGATPDENFLTAVENAVPSQEITKLVDGEYSAVAYYANETAPNCDPFRSSQSCQRNFVLMITSGTGADKPPNPGGVGTPHVWSDSTHCGDTDYANLTKNSCYGYNNDLRALAGRQYVSTYIVNTMGTQTSLTEAQGFCNPTVAPATTGEILCQAAKIGGGVYYQVVDPATLRESLIQAFQDILKRAAAGTAASVLASGEGSGANLLQAVFYPRTQTIARNGIFDTEIAWIGRLSNFWYYIDPFFNASSIYEDNASTGIFDLSTDNKITFFYDIANERTMAHRYPPSSTSSDTEFERLNVLWESGLKLWQRTSARTIKTSIGSGLIDFPAAPTDADATTLLPFFAFSTTDGSDSDTYIDGDLDHDGDVDKIDAKILIRYIYGEDFPTTDYPLITWLRKRTVGVDVNGDGVISGTDEAPRVWKLGDILNSTPKISSWIPVSNYDQVYKDTSYTAYINTTASDTGYKNRGVVFAGSNDGMLHAFKLGNLELSGSWKDTGSKKAKLSGTGLGEELWAFIPKNVLPYLKYMKEPGYCHVYTIDLSPYIFDASINKPSGCTEADSSNCTKTVDSWRTIVIGGMRYGGACRNSCTGDCVATPATNLGYSSYFALDITNQTSPELLWEFSNEDLGFSTTGPAVVRVGDKNNNGKWFVVVGSGPTGPISTSDQQFLGHSDQDLRLFILDLKTGTLLRPINTSITNAFAGSMLNVTTDVDLDYQDDVVYIGYTKAEDDVPSATTQWNQGGVGRLQTKELPDPANWVWSVVYDDIGPVTASVTRLINKNKGQLWLFFATGRYYFERLSTGDDENGQRSLFGLKEPCYSLTGLTVNCTTTFSGSLIDVTSTPNADPATITNGWRIDLDDSDDYAYSEGNPPVAVTRNYRAERVITDPLSTTSGLVFFTSYKPYNDACAYGGKSFIWAMRYNTGGAPGALLKGIALLQVSTGSIEQVNLSTAFTLAGGRKSSALEGVPPLQQGLSLLSTPPPIKRTIHIRER